MLYRKNLFTWEQGLRVVAGAGLGAWALSTGSELGWYGLLAGVALALTGVLGFCPACYAMKRKGPRQRA